MILGTLLGAIFSIIHSSDGAVDDFATTAFIAAAQEKNKHVFDFPGVIITNADCEPISALSACFKTTKFLNMNTQVGLSSSRVWVQFPWQWRLDSLAIDLLPCLSQITNQDLWSLPEGNHLLANLLMTAAEVKIIATGPLTTIADTFKAHPELIAKVSELHWMGGAIDVSGNILNSPEIPKELLNEKAEWNVFCDADAADWIFKNTSFSFYLYPLDISDQTIPNDFMKILTNKKETVHSKYIAECYKIVESMESYRMWDVVTAAGILCPEVLEPPMREKLRVELGFKEHGALMKDDQGREVFVYKEFKDNDPRNFYEAVANLLTK